MLVTPEDYEMGAQVNDKKENLDRCSCPNCPAMKGSPLTGALYCVRDKAEEYALEASCNCSFCPVADKYALELEYYCVRGRSADIP
jgi:hypothetical protein